jgi:hypothetical protein
VHVNLGKAHGLLGSLTTPSVTYQEQPVLSSQKRIYHYALSVQSFTAAYATGRTDLLEQCTSSFESLLALHAGEGLEELLRLEASTISLPSPLRARATLALAERVHLHGVKMLSLDEWKDALLAFHEAERPLTRTSELVVGRDVQLEHELAELRESNTLHILIAEGRRAIANGDEQSNHAMMYNDSDQMMEGIWHALDKYSEAGLLGRGRDIETEAIAVARRGKIYARVLRNEALARPLLMHATELATSLAPRSFHGVAWYEDCTRQLQTYRDATFAADSRAAERKRQEELKSQEPTRKKMKTELDALDAFANASNVYKLLEHIYAKYPPKVDAVSSLAACSRLTDVSDRLLCLRVCIQFLRDRVKVLKEITDANADTVKKVLVKSAQLHYHPDKNPERLFGLEWHVLCLEISKHLNGKYNMLKM